MDGEHDEVPESIVRQPVLWIGVVASVVISVGLGTQRTGPGVPSWWEAGLGLASLALLAGVVAATRRTLPRASARVLIRAVLWRVFGTGLLLLGAGLGWALAAGGQRGVIETLKGTCFMYGGVGVLGALAIWLVVGLFRFVASMPSWSVDGWAGFVCALFFVALFVLLGVTMGDDVPADGNLGGVVYIVTMLLGLNDASTPLLTALAWGSVAGMVGCFWFVARRTPPRRQSD